MKSFRFLIGILLALAAFEFSTVAQEHPLPRRCNIILIVADSLGYGDLSCYGQTNFQTPNLDQLAADGIRFTNYFVGSAASSPALASLMLGKNATHLRQRADVDIPLAGADVTVAQVLKNSGYHTGLIGDWVLGDQNSYGAPWRKGFEEFAGYFDPDDAKNVYADFMWRYAPDARLNPTNNQMETFDGRETIYDNVGGTGQYIPDLFTHAAMNFAKNNQPDEFNRFRPFFLTLDYTIPGNGNLEVPTDAPFSDAPWPQSERNRAAMIARLDGYIGQLREQLSKIGQESNTVIFFTSDIIPQKSGGVDPKFFHENLSAHDLRVPMIVCWPGKIPDGQVSGVKCSAQDFLPTAVDIALIPTEAPKDIDGTSILPEMVDRK
jgi:arylsulfatase A-like enzyme